jgi:bifunctional UDP-N-acetylglucosamine pyrophosphorylase/glucosamine-1-phosphate N-acetyltransferase
VFDGQVSGFNMKIAAILLAAGKGTRMKSDLPKVAHPVCGRPMVEFVIDIVSDLRIKSCVVVLGHKADDVRKVLSRPVATVLQKQQRGTADAVKQAMPKIPAATDTVIILYGDTPLLQTETIRALLDHHARTRAAATILTADMNDPAGYGRIQRDSSGCIEGIVEDKDADEFQKDIKEINTGIIAFEKKALDYALKRIKPNNAKKEYYLTDAIGILRGEGLVIEGKKISDANEAMGVNSRVELAQANKCMQRRINDRLMKEGVGIIDPETVFIGFDVSIGTDTVIYPFTVIEKDVIIGSYCSIGPFAVLSAGTAIADHSVIRGAGLLPGADQHY